MSGNGFAKFVELRGRRIIEAAGVLWHSTKMGIYMRIPYHEPFDPPRSELQKMMRTARILGVRFPSLHQPGLASGIYVCNNKQYGLSSIHARQRTQVRRGLDKCEVRRVDEAELLGQGFQCNVETMCRQNRFDDEFGEAGKWRRFVRAVGECPEIGSVGAFVDGHLAAYAITYREDGWFHILHQMSRRDTLNLYPNHALTYTLIKEGLADPNISTVCFGLIGLVSGEGLHEYKTRLGFELFPQNSLFLLHPGVERLLSNSRAVDLISFLRKLRPESQGLERVESVLVGARLARISTVSVAISPTSH